MDDLSRALTDIAALLDSLGLDYAIMGGIAVRAYGIPRATYDVDFTAAIPREQLSTVFEKVQGLGYTVPESYAHGWVDRVADFPLVKFRLFIGGNGVDVDVFLAETLYQQTLLARRRRMALDDLDVWLVSPEDLILLKLLANRPRDIADVTDVVFMQGQLDLAYMRQWALKLGIQDRLETALRDQYPQ